ncbi:hypothetical protein L207DRAFT_581395 [Hyaloscypha variabilis F]|uniref:Uncharacterized protein n=1 Tax=Hyaloscypha variabilis (strain UAMH 11265 / GT02V1 / F) TaxID=1149755 RepID=A0A2J6RW82_HYAVF|nr:hypothetical protein L207DRAFT_581395 [Hyaloscypha variabilis F]
MNLGVVCAQCGRLILQKTRDEDGIEHNGLAGARQGLLDSAPHDPFDSSAIPISHKMHGLIHHYIHLVIYPTNAPIYQGDGFRDLMNVAQISLALSDPVCMRAVMAIAASQLSTIKSNALAPYHWKGREEAKQLIDDAVYHMSEGVRLLNERFEDPKQSLTVASVFGAALLGLCPFYLGDISLAEAHHEGMLKMIELRGGINALPRYLASQMIRLSSNMTWKKKTRTRLPMYNSRFRENGVQVSAIEICNKGADELFPANRRYVALQPASSPFRNNSFETFLWGELFSIACDLHMLSYMLDLNARHPRKLGSVQREYFEDTYAAVLHALAAFQYPDDIGVMKTAAYYRQHAWRLAAIMYVKSGIRGWDKVMHPIKAANNEYISALHALDLENLWVSMPEILVWLLFIGTCGTWDGVELSWMLVELRRGTRLLDIKSAQELEKLLKSMLLTNSLKERHLYVIWQAFP